MKTLARQEWGGCTEVRVEEADVVGPLLPPAEAPRPPPAAVVQHSSPVVVLPHLYTCHTAFGANWETQAHTQE